MFRHCKWPDYTSVFKMVLKWEFGYGYGIVAFTHLTATKLKISIEAEPSLVNRG